MAFGVDLGTTNSSIAWADQAGTVHSLLVRIGLIEPYDAVERSVVLDPETEDFVVGQNAFTEAARQNSRLVRSFKRRFDKQRLREHRYRAVYQVTNDYDPASQSIRVAESTERVPLEYDEYTLSEVIAAGSRLFHHLLTRAELDPETEGSTALDTLLQSAADSVGETLHIGVPVSFGPTARRRLLASLVSSGCFGSGPTAYRRVLKRCRFVYEPLALMSVTSFFDPQRVLVFDYGGGTLDIAVLDVDFDRSGSQVVVERALGGLPRAGDFLDETFRNWLLGQRPRLRRSYASQIKRGSDYDIYRAEAAFANAKIRLSTEDEVVVPLFDAPVTRDELENALGSEIDEAVRSALETVERAGLAPNDIGTVLMTGGSSLIPIVQERIRRGFEHLGDDEIIAGRPGDVDSAREALTGVSRGLARFGFLEGFETSAACNYTMVVPGTGASTVCLPVGSPDETSLAKSPTVRVPVNGAKTTFALYSDLVRDAFCGALVDVQLPSGVDYVMVSVSAARDRCSPAFAVYVRGRRSPIAKFDLDALSGTELEAFVDGDAEWLPPDVDPSIMVLTKRLSLGDFVEWSWNGGRRRGVVTGLRELASNEPVLTTDGFDPEPYVITVAREVEREVRFNSTSRLPWKVGDVRLV